MAFAAQENFALRAPLAWFREFLIQELAPFPGRGALVARIVVSSTLIMLLVMTFGIPYGAISATYTLQITRESQQATISSVKALVIAFIVATADALLGAMLVLGNPELRFVWIIGTLFMIFYGISVLTNYGSAVAIGFLLVSVIPVFDSRIAAGLKVEQTLWALGALTLATVVTLMVELLLAKVTTGPDLSRLLDDRLAAVESLLRCYGLNCPVVPATEENLRHLSMVGTSRLRAMLRRTRCSAHYRESMGSAIALVGRLVDTAIELQRIDFSGDLDCILALSENVGHLRADLVNGRIPSLIEVHEETEGSHAAPLLSSMESIVSAIAEAFIGSQLLGAYELPSSEDSRTSTVFVSDALVNPEHFKFALRGCLAAGLSYIIYTLIDWPTLSTAIIACFVTALATIGSSRQKQMLLVLGSIAGGIAGVASQLFILPAVDSIGGFTIAFVVFTTAAAWLTTSTPRLAYFGFQFAFAYNFVNLQEFTIQTSLAPARDRVAGILLGLFMMWVVFDRLWGSPASVQMRETFIATLRLMAEFAKEPVSTDPRAAIERSYSIRDRIDRDFDNVRALADATLLEFGPSRQQALAFRNRIRLVEPRLRVLFVMGVALWNYRAQLPGFELPGPVLEAQKAYDAEVARALNAMANQIEGKSLATQGDLKDALGHLERSAAGYASDASQAALGLRLQALLVRSRRVENLVDSVLEDI